MQKELSEQNPILKFAFDFSPMVIEYGEKLEAGKRFVIASQLFKSGAATGANATEAQSAESRADFIHKMKIAAREADETQYWLRLCDYANNYRDCKHLIMELDEIHKILGKIISTSKRNSPV
jgi:four helix bundle protein